MTFAHDCFARLDALDDGDPVFPRVACAHHPAFDFHNRIFVGRRRLCPACIRREGLHDENAVAIERVSDRGPGQRHDLLGRTRDDVHIGEHP